MFFGHLQLLDSFNLWYQAAAQALERFDKDPANGLHERAVSCGRPPVCHTIDIFFMNRQAGTALRPLSAIALDGSQRSASSIQLKLTAPIRVSSFDIFTLAFSNKPT